MEDNNKLQFPNIIPGDSGISITAKTLHNRKQHQFLRNTITENLDHPCSGTHFLNIPGHLLSRNEIPSLSYIQEYSPSNSYIHVPCNTPRYQPGHPTLWADHFERHRQRNPELIRHTLPTYPKSRETKLPILDDLIRSTPTNDQSMMSYACSDFNKNVTTTTTSKVLPAVQTLDIDVVDNTSTVLRETRSMQSINSQIAFRNQIPNVKSEIYTCLWMDCYQKFTLCSELVDHIKSCHAEQRTSQENYICLWQGCPRKQRTFNARYKLLAHMRIHSGERPNKCTYDGCDKAFSRIENFKIHLRSHTGEKPYTCSMEGCLKAFSNSSDRAKHQRTHADSKPYVCIVHGCTKRYTDPSSLRKHAKIHQQQFLDLTSYSKDPPNFRALNPISKSQSHCTQPPKSTNLITNDVNLSSFQHISNSQWNPPDSFHNQIKQDTRLPHIHQIYFLDQD